MRVPSWRFRSSICAASEDESGTLCLLSELEVVFPRLRGLGCLSSWLRRSRQVNFVKVSNTGYLRLNLDEADDNL